MNQTVTEKTAKTAAEAVNLALEELGTSIDNVEVIILDEGNKGFLGIGSKQAKVRVSIKKNPDEKNAEKFLNDIFVKMGINADINIKVEEDTMTVDINGEDAGVLIGRHGETLDSLQYLTSLYINKNREEYLKINMDMENYREKRKETLVKLSMKIAEKVKRSKRPVSLEPMNPYERRIIHSVLQEVSGIETYSVGEEPFRKVVVKLK